MIKPPIELSLANQKYTDGSYQNQLYQPWLDELSPNPTSANIFNMRCFAQYDSFTQREMRPILVFLHRGSSGMNILSDFLIPKFIGTQTRILVANVDRIPEIAYNYRNVVPTFPALIWTFRSKVLRVLTNFTNYEQVQGFALSTIHARNRGLFRTNDGT
jgi:hypothetical protein